MCDNHFVLIDVPSAALDSVDVAYCDFRRNPGDYENFLRLDWALRVAMAKWESYSIKRKIEACG